MNKLKKIKEELFSIDEAFRNHMIMQLGEAILLFICGIIIAIMIKDIKFFLFTLLASIIFIGLIYYKILACVEGSCLQYEGVCICLSKGERIKYPYLIMQMESGEYIEINGATIKKKKIREGDTIVAYIPYKSLYSVNDNTYKTNTVFYIHIKKHDYKYTKK